MNSRRNNDPPERNRIAVPDRGEKRPDYPSVPEPTQDSSTKLNEKVEIPKDLASQRQSFGFDDIPVDEDDMTHVQFRDIFKAWGKQAIKDSPLEKKFKQVKSRRKKLNEIKNDLKWAIQADLDEPVEPRRRQQPTQPPPQPRQHPSATMSSPTPLASDDHKTIDININLNSLPKLPRIPKPKLDPIIAVLPKAKRILLTKKGIAVLGIVIIGTVGFTGVSSLLSHHSESKNAGAPNAGGANTPEYKTVLPDSKDIGELGGWRRVSPPESNPVFAYADKISGVVVNVSQQPVPENFKDDKNSKVKELAKSFSATHEVSVKDSTLYLGTSSKGPQSAIVLKNDTLVLMKSEAKITDEKWRDYVNNLK